MLRKDTGSARMPAPTQALARVLTVLGRVTPEGSGYLAHCPAHDDKNPSLSIAEDGDRVLVHCHAGCSQEAVLEALEARGIQRRELFADDLRPSKTREIVARYPYRDESGELLFEAVRYSPKGFSQRRPDGAGGWIPNLRGVRRVLYKLPEILAADPELVVYVTEGEKDANALAGLGLVATCNPMGAGKWRDEYSESLRGRTVAILPDADEPGHEHALQVARALHGIAAEVRIVPLPGPGKDASDWLLAGGTAEQLAKLFEDALPFDPARSALANTLLLLQDASEEDEERPSEIVIRCARDEELEEIPEPPSLLGAGLWPKGSLFLLAGREGLGKSWLVAELAIALASGRPWYGIRTLAEGSRVLVFSPEHGRGSFRKRLRTILGSYGLDEDALEAIRSRLHYITREEWSPSGTLHKGRDAETILELVERSGADVVLFDPLYRFHGDILDLGPLLALADGRIFRETGATCGLVHHHRKSSQTGDRADSGSKAAGSFALLAAPKVGFALEVAKADAGPLVDEEDGEDRPERRILSLSCHKANEGARPAPIYLEHDPSAFGRLVPSSWRPRRASSGEELQEERVSRLRALASKKPGHLFRRAEAEAEIGLRSRGRVLDLIRAAGFVELGKDGRVPLYGPPRGSGFVPSFPQDSFSGNEWDDLV